MGEKGHHSHTEAQKENPPPPPTSHGKSQTTREIGIGGGVKDIFLDGMVDHWLDVRGKGKGRGILFFSHRRRRKGDRGRSRRR